MVYKDGKTVQPSRDMPIIILHPAMHIEQKTREIASPDQPDDYPEGGQGWIQVASAFLTLFIAMGHMMCFGVYQQAYRVDPLFDNLPTSSISLVGSLTSGMIPLFGFFAGRLADQYGYGRVQFFGGVTYALALIAASFATSYWQIVLTHGLLFGISCSFSYFPAMAIVSHWFKKRIGLATGITVSGTGVGGFVLSPVIRVIINELGWRWALRIVGLVGGFLVIMSSMLLKTRLAPSGSKPFQVGSLFKNSVFVRFYLSSVFNCFGFLIPFYFMPLYATRNGLTPVQGALLVSIMNGTSAIGRIVMGILADYFGQGIMLTLCLYTASLSTLLLWPFSSSLAPLIVYSVIYGLAAGGTNSLAFSAISTYFGQTNIASVIGVVGTSAAIGNLFGPSSFALINDAFTPSGDNMNFLPGMMLAGGCVFVGSCLMLSLLFIKKNPQNQA